MLITYNRGTAELRIGYFIDTFYPMIDGVVMVVDSYARYMNERAEVTVFAPDCGDYDFSAFPYRVVCCKSLPLPRLDYRLPLGREDIEFREELKHTPLDIVHIHSFGTVAEAGIRYAKKRGIPAVATLHSQVKQNFKEALRAEALTVAALHLIVSLYDKADECWTVNSAMAKLYTNEYGGKKTPVVMRNATDMLPCSDAASSRKKINEMFALNDAQKVLLFVGRIDFIKNIPMIIEALEILKRRDAEEFPYKLLIVGSGRDEEALRAAIAARGLSDDVIMTGRISDRGLMAEIYSRAELFVFPSTYDANSLVQIEAAAQSTPTVFVRGSITSSSIEENVSGYLCGSTAQSLADKITDIFSDSALYSSVCKGARRLVYRTWDTACLEAYERYEALCKSYVCNK